MSEASKLPPKPQLLKEWFEYKGSEPWSVGDVAELIAEASSLGEDIERERIINILESLTYIDEAGDEMLGEFTKDLIARINDDDFDGNNNA
jgi:tellurite resistance protein